MTTLEVFAANRYGRPIEFSRIGAPDGEWLALGPREDTLEPGLAVVDTSTPP